MPMFNVTTQKWTYDSAAEAELNKDWTYDPPAEPRGGGATGGSVAPSTKFST